jgi:preprotein translocase subunit Sec61beta
MDEDGTGLKIKPEHVAMAAGAVIVLKVVITTF